MIKTNIKKVMNEDYAVFEIEIRGHDINECCARVSTLFDILNKKFYNSCIISEKRHGYSLLKCNTNDIVKIDYINIIVDSFEDLAKLYKNNIEVIINNEKVGN